MTTHSIGFIGGGNMARSLIGGLINSGQDAAAILVSDPVAGALEALQQEFGLTPAADNQAVLDTCDTVVLAVKPQVLRQVCLELDISARPHVLFISIAAGVRTTAIQKWLGEDCAVVRAMPNTPALVQSGASALFATPAVSETQHDTAESILRAVGVVLWVELEDELDAVTALSGSGPAYFFLVMEAMEEAGRRLGLDTEVARLLTLETAFGAAKLALELGEPAADLRRKVTSPGGTTEAALAVLEQGDLRGLFERALDAAHRRARELADELGQ